jgi:uncharacterized protein YjbI with pentapeptide repeats
MNAAVPMSRGRGALPRLVCLLLLASWSLLAAAHAAAPPAAVVGSGQALKPSCPAPGAGNDYSGKPLVLCNFNKADLRNAKFANANLTAVVFDGADLTGADFSGATFADSGDAMLPTDFSFANLTGASFNGATFKGLTYLTYATLTCADFSNIDISTSNAVFGPSPLKLDKSATCKPPLTRTTFAQTVMNCEFIDDWNFLDLNHATGLQACAAQLLGHDFSGAGLDFADLSSMDLSGTTWAGASLRRTVFQGSTLDNAKGLDGASRTELAAANFKNVSAKLVNFSNGKLNGADFSGAELQGANFSGASLIDDPNDPLGPIRVAAKFDNAHLQYVNFSGATLNSVSFKYASLYGSMIGAPPASCQTDIAQCGNNPVTGSTCSCATLANANLTRTDFSSAFLYGVDFSSANGNTKVNGTTFSGAVLVGANFNGAAFGIDTSQGGQATTLDGAWLQGANLRGVDLTNVSLAGAYVDFGVINSDGSARPGGNLALLLTANHTKFRGWTGSATPCVHVENPNASVLPTDNGSMTCPNGNSYAVGCGALAPRDNSAGGTPANPPPPCNTPTTNAKWCGGSVTAAVGIVGWYRRQSTYENGAAPSAQCNGQPVETRW